MKTRINYDLFLMFDYSEKEKGIKEKERLLKDGYKVVTEGIYEDEPCFFDLRKQEKYEDGILVELNHEPLTVKRVTVKHKESGMYIVNIPETIKFS